MSFAKRQPTNTNLLSRNRFKLVFPKIPAVEYFIRDAAIPPIRINPVAQPTPFNRVWVTGVNVEYFPFKVEIKCDEDLVAWQEIHDWGVGAGFPRSFDEYIDAHKEGLYTDITLVMLSNANNPTMNFQFKNCFPIELGPILMQADDDGKSYHTFTVTFRYDSYSVTRIKNPTQ